jgi:DNA-binding beta-propeller fold protein YncE
MGKRAVLIGVVSASIFICATSMLVPALARATAQFGEEGSGAGQFVQPTGVAVEQESGDLYIADTNNQRIDEFDAAGNFLLAWGFGVADGKGEAQTCTTTCLVGLPGSGSGQFAAHSAEGVAIDNDPLSSSHGDVYVIDSGDNRVEKFDPSGNFLLMFGGEVNATSKGNICAAGESCQAGVAGTGEGEFERLNGHSIAVDAGGRVFVGDENRIQRFSGAGAVEAQIALPGAGFIENMVVDSAGNFYVGASGLTGVHEFDSAGTDLGSPRDEAGIPSAFALALGPGDELFVNDEREGIPHHILEFDTSGTQTASFDAGGIGGARGIAYANALSALYVLSAAAVRVVSPPPPGPLVLSQSSEAIEPTSATLSATVNPEGPEASTYHFEYGESTAYGQSSAEEPVSGGAFEDQTVAAAITGLQPRTTYHFRVVVSNGTQTTLGEDQSFTTLPPALIDGESATHVSAKSARLGAELNPLGSETEYHFEYGTSASYGTILPVPDASAGSGHADVSLSVEVQGLSPNTTYHYRVVAHNALGSVQGEDRTFKTEGEEPSVLADGRQWEMVSPPNKEGVSLEAIAKEGAVIQAAEDGSAITYVAKAAIEAEAPSNRSIADTQVLSKRSGAGWASKDIETPHETVVPFVAGHLSEYTLFSGDLSHAVLQPQGETPLSPQTSERTPYLRSNGEQGQFCLSVASCYRPLAVGCPPLGEACSAAVAEAANVPAGTKFSVELVLVSASADASRAILASPQNLTTGYEGAGERSLFEWSGGTLRPVSVLPSGEAHGAEVGSNAELNMRGAVSTEGDRVIFGAGAGPSLYLRDMTLAKTVQLDALQGGTGGVGRVEFQGANRDASKVFFTDDSRLSADATARPGKPDLYECEVSVVAGSPVCALKDLTVDSTTQAADVQGTVAAFSEDGRMVYFAANGVLAAGAVPGNCASESEGASCNLYVRDTVSGQTRLVAELSGLDAPDWLGHGFLANLTARSSPDGRYLAFMSQRSLTGYDNHDAQSKAADEEVFLYDAVSGKVSCASCKASGARPEGILDPEKFPGLLVDRPRTWESRWLAASIPGYTPFNLTQSIYQSRYLSNSGRMFFNSADALVGQDANGKEDVYQYEPQGVGDCSKAGGCQSLISSGSSPEESAFMDASADGSNVFFMTAAKLSEADVDSDFDIYDAHICTGSSPCPSQATNVPPPCTTSDSCRAAPAPQPSIFGAPASATFSGAGNLAAPASKAPVKAKRLTRAQLLAKALKSCQKKAKKKRVACKRQAERRYGAKKAKKGAKKSGAKKSSTHLGDSAAKGRA